MMGVQGSGIRLFGDMATIAALKGLGQRYGNQVVKRATKKAAAIILRALKEEIRAMAVDTGSLEDSITQRSKTYARGQVIWTGIGAKSRQRYLTQTEEKPRPHIRQPTKYFHLVEFGWRHAPGTHVMSRAWESSKGRALTVFTNTVRSETAKLAQRLAMGAPAAAALEASGIAGKAL